MARYGKNMKLSIAKPYRERLHAVLGDVLGCQSVSPADELVVYRFGDGFQLGVYFTDEGLDDDAYLLAPWLEFLVADVDGDQEKLTELGVEVVPYPRDPEHVYRRLPGGPVFRLAATSGDSAS
jgi:hypothetical protein